MKHSILILLLAASTAAASAQTTPTPTTAAKPAVKTATAAKPASTASASAKPAAKPAAAASSAIKLPAGVPPAPPNTVTKTAAFVLRYQDLKIGTGADAEPNKLYKVNYTLYLGANGLPEDGTKIDSNFDRPGPPLKDKDGKPVLGDDGKPKLGDPAPMSFPQGMGRLIPGFDQGFEGMKIGGKRRLFVPWQLGYGAKGHPGPDAAHPGIPAKADLIFDVELVEVSDMPTPPNHPGGMGGPGGPGGPTI